MTRWEKLNRKSIEYSLAIKDFMVMHGAKEESIKTIVKMVQLSYMIGAAEADKTKWSEEDEKMLISIIYDFGLGRMSSASQDLWLKSLKERFVK